MLPIFVSIAISLFSNPYVKTVKKENLTVTIEIFCKDKNCGKIFITKDNVTFYLSCGLKLAKGAISIKEFYFTYEEDKLVLRSTKNINKEQLTVKCSEEHYDLMRSFVEELRKIE